MEKLEIKGFEPIYKGIPPFMKFEGGFGYIGVLLEDKESGKLQCHLCGTLAKNLAKHLFHKHKDINSVEYRKKVGLNLTTSLMCQSTIKKFRNNFLDLTEEKRNKVIKRLKENNSKVHKEGKHRIRSEYSSSQYQNRFGTCPAQAKTLFWKEYKELGHIPTNDEMSEKLRYIVYTRFSSYKNALISWGVSEELYRSHITEGKINAIQARAENDYFPKYSAEEVRNIYSDFYFQNKRLPTWGEVKQYGLPGRAPFTRVFGKNKSEVISQFKVKDLSYNSLK